MSESKELVLVTLPAAAELEAAFISDDYINRLISDIRQKATSVVGDVNTVIPSISGDGLPQVETLSKTH